MRRAVHDGQMPRRLHEKATRISSAQAWQRTRAKPWARRPAQVGGEFAVDVAGQAATIGLAELGEQGLGVARDELVQDGALGGAPLVAAGRAVRRAGRAFVEAAGEHGRAT
jgi:hypothetical protein